MFQRLRNEGKACDAVVRALETHLGEPRSIAAPPAPGGASSPVELLVTIGSSRFAIEHTEIEAFEGQIASGRYFEELVQGLRDELHGALPSPGTYYLDFPIDTRLGARSANLGAARARLIAWVRHTAVALHAECPSRPGRHAHPRGVWSRHSARIDGFPYDVTLRRLVHWTQSGRHDGSLLSARFAPEGVEDLRRERLSVALARKCPKLSLARSLGYSSVLVLETNDISLTNEHLIAEALSDALRQCDTPPDQIFLVDTVLESRWTVWKWGGENGYWEEDSPIEVDARALVDLTSR